jgi:hypothetical protein
MLKSGTCYTFPNGPLSDSYTQAWQPCCQHQGAKRGNQFSLGHVPVTFRCHTRDYPVVSTAHCAKGCTPPTTTAKTSKKGSCLVAVYVVTWRESPLAALAYGTSQVLPDTATIRAASPSRIYLHAIGRGNDGGRMSTLIFPACVLVYLPFAGI